MPLVLDDWQQIVSSASWEPRSVLRVVSDGTNIYMTGGLNAGSRFEDVWRSSDGIAWFQLSSNAGYNPRSGHGFIYFDNYFWIMGGYNEDIADFDNIVLRSPDCVNWTSLGAAAWTKRHEHTLIVHDNKMWIIGGFDGSNWLNDCWYSENGIAWTQTSAAVWTNGFREHASFSFLNKLWVTIGDYNTGRYRVVCYSDDGITWNNKEPTEWPKRREHEYVINPSGTEVAIVGGNDGINVYLNDVWRTRDGLNWTEITQKSSFSARSDFGLVNHNGKTYIIGGIAVSELNDVWAAGYTLTCDFTGDVLSGAIYHFVQFISEFTGTPVSYLWNFGDGETSTDQHPLHKYRLPGTFTVSLTVTDSDEDTYTETKTAYVTVENIAFEGEPVSGKSPLRVQFTI